MSAAAKIKWRDPDLDKLRREVKRFNAKLDRVARKDEDAWNYLPERLSMRTLRKEIESRQEFNNTISSIERFMRKGAETPLYSKTGNVKTKWEVHELTIKKGVVNRQRSNELELLAPSPQKGTMHYVKELNLQPKHFDYNKVKPGKAYDAMKKSLEKQAKPGYREYLVSLYKENYLKGIRNALGPAGEKLYQFVAKLTPDQMRRGYYANAVLSIEFVYDPLAAKTVAGEALAAWQEFLGQPVEEYEPEIDAADDGTPDFGDDWGNDDD